MLYSLKPVVLLDSCAPKPILLMQAKAVSRGKNVGPSSKRNKTPLAELNPERLTKLKENGSSTQDTLLIRKPSNTQLLGSQLVLYA